MSENDTQDVQPDQKPQEDPRIADLTKQIESLKAEKTTDSQRNRDIERQLATLTGQLSTLSAAFTEPAKPEEVPDINTEPEKAFEYHFNKRTKPILDQANARGAAYQRELAVLKNKDDFETYADEIKAFESQIPAETLATPGTYDHILGMIRTKHQEEIVAKKVAAEVAKFQADAAKSAAASPASLSGTADTGKGDEKLSPDEARIAAKLGISPKDYAEVSKSVVFDGIRYRGAVGT